MSKKFLFIIPLLLFISSIFSQTLLKGKVVNEKSEPLENAVIYINNTTFGTFTDKDGNYELKIDEGTYTLIISFLGYKTLEKQIKTAKKSKTLYFVLHPKTNMLDEIIIKKTVYDKHWYYNLSQFKRTFLGRTLLAKNCKILNPKVLHFEFDKKTGLLTADARKPLQILNKDLGYKITYDLVDFSLGRKQVTYLGYTKYQNLKGGKRKQKRWTKNRLKAYHGSRMHFVRSLRSQKLKDEGFNVNQFKRVLNPERPSEEKIRHAIKIVRLSGKPLNFRKEITQPITQLDTAMVILKKVKLPKYIDYLYKTSVPYKDMILVSGKNILLQFKDYLSIIYTKEAEEDTYARRNMWKTREPLNVQTSAITMTQKTVILDPTGDIIDPLAIFAEGYWSYERFADMLPLNYQPKKE